MKHTILLRYLGAASCLVLASCESTPYNDPSVTSRRGTGYSLDNPPASGQSRYMPGTTPTTTAPGASTTTTETTETTTPGTTTTPPTTTTTTTETTTTTPPTPPPPPPTAATTTAPPSYGSPVPGRRGFVYPPGVDPVPENMVDVRDFTPGQKVRDPRTGKIFLVP